jgi:hypothetical protein
MATGHLVAGLGGRHLVTCMRFGRWGLGGHVAGMHRMTGGRIPAPVLIVTQTPIVVSVGIVTTVRRVAAMVVCRQVLGGSDVLSTHPRVARLAARVRGLGALAPVAQLVYPRPYRVSVGAGRVVPQMGHRPGPIHMHRQYTGQPGHLTLQTLQLGGAETVSQRHLDYSGLLLAHHLPHPQFLRA